MDKAQDQTPLFDKLKTFSANAPISFHVPGHKNGAIFMNEAQNYFSGILPLDLTELTGLDDLHAPDGVIAEAEALAADFFKSDATFFLVGGSTAGNLAMILATCSLGDQIIVQRNCHKSIMNGLELAGAASIFIAPDYDAVVGRYTNPSLKTFAEAIRMYPDAKAVVLTYPDYFGKAYDLQAMIELAHQHDIAVLVDEAHGVHFSLGEPFPKSALELGADIVVQSAHKTAPAMTMASYLHMKTTRISKQKIAHYLQIIQSSSPSYPLMASLDIARAFLAGLSKEAIREIVASVANVRALFDNLAHCHVVEQTAFCDPLKITLQIENGVSGYQIAEIFEAAGIYPELATHNQLLFIHGLQPFDLFDKLKESLQSVNEQLKIGVNHDTIELTRLFPNYIEEIALSYEEMKRLKYRSIPFLNAIGLIAAEAVIPYPPGIPLILKGTYITERHIEILISLINKGVRLQQRDQAFELKVFMD